MPNLITQFVNILIKFSIDYGYFKIFTFITSSLKTYLNNWHKILTLVRWWGNISLELKDRLDFWF